MVSVILPVRDGGAAFAVALDSVLAQTFTDFELLILDDGSCDETAQLARTRVDTRVTVVSDGRRLGLAARLNQGIDLARGRYVARMDADDVCFPERFEHQVRFLEAYSDVDVVGCRALVFRENGATVGLLPFAESHEKICASPWRGVRLPHPTWMGRIGWFRRHRYRMPEALRAEDQELLLRAYSTSRYHSLDKILLGYRQGRFSLQKTLIARHSLLAAQLRIFVQRSQWRNASLAVGIMVLRVLFDLIAALPGCERVFFARMSEPAPAEAVETLRVLLAPSKRSR